MADAWTLPAPAFPALRFRPGVTAGEVLGRRIATVVARRGQGAALQAFVAREHAITFPDGPRRVAGEHFAFLGIGPGKWLVVSDAAASLALLAPFAAVVDQSGAYAVLTLSGDGAAPMLGRALAIDIDPASFPTGSVATTVIEHVGVTVVRNVVTPPSFDLYVARSYAASLAHWLNEASG